MAAPSEVEDLGNLSATLWTLAIDSHGTAYGIGYPGDLYQVDLDNCALSMIGSTGKDVWYTQSMAFDNDTGELYWAQISSNADHGFYRVDTQTGAATPLGEIGGSGAQLTGLFMVSENITPPEPEIISEIYVEGFTEPVWGEHPDFEVNVASDAHCSIDEVCWLWVQDGHVVDLTPEDVFNHEDGVYYMGVLFSPEEGYVFADEMTVYFNGDASFFDAQNSIVYPATGKFQAWTINFTVTNPDGIDELTNNILKGLEGQNVNIYDMTGRLVLRERYSGQFHFEGLKPGIYVVNIAGNSFKLMIE